MPCHLSQDPSNATTRIFGWQGISLRVPEAWELGAYGGDRFSGYAHLDDGVQVRLRIQWAHARTIMENPAILLNWCRRAVVRTVKNPIQFDEIGIESFAEAFRPDKTMVGFRWRPKKALSEPGTLGAAWHCRICNRVVWMEVSASQYSSPAAGRPELASDIGNILASAQDHRDDGWWQWSAYGFAFSAPETYNLVRADLQPGRLRFFLRESSRAWMRVERWGLASRLLQDAPLESWPDELVHLAGVRRPEKIAAERALHGNCPAYRFKGESRPEGWRRLLSGPIPFEGRVWYDSEQDKVLAAIVSGGTPGLLEEVAAGMEWS